MPCDNLQDEDGISCSVVLRQSIPLKRADTHCAWYDDNKSAPTMPLNVRRGVSKEPDKLRKVLRVYSIFALWIRVCVGGLIDRLYQRIPVGLPATQGPLSRQSQTLRLCVCSLYRCVSWGALPGWCFTGFGFLNLECCGPWRPAGGLLRAATAGLKHQASSYPDRPPHGFAKACEVDASLNRLQTIDEFSRNPGAAGSTDTSRTASALAKSHNASRSAVCIAS